MRRDLRILSKFVLMLLGCFFFLFLLGKAVVHIVEPVLEKEHTYITLQEAGNLVWLLADEAESQKEKWSGLTEKVYAVLDNLEGDSESLLT